MKPEEATPGIPTWYASVRKDCPCGCGILVKTRESRPIKLEGNPDHPLNRGKLCARAQASVLSLYDPDRLRAPKTAWDDADKAIGAKLASLAAQWWPRSRADRRAPGPVDLAADRGVPVRLPQWGACRV